MNTPDQQPRPDADTRQNPPPARPDPGIDTYRPNSRLGRLFIALTNRDFRFIWFFYILNYLGMTMEMLAQGWMVLEITDSVFWVGGVAGLRGAGQVMFGIFAGAIVDRFNRRVILTIAQMLRAVIFLGMAILLLTGGIELWHILVSTVMLGMLMATVLPSSEAMIYDTVGPRRLLNALVITHGAFSIARIPGSILAGFLIDGFGLGYCFVAMTAVMLVSPLPILIVKTRYQRPPDSGGLWKNVREGLSYASRTSSIKSLLIFSAVVELFGFSYFVMLPVIAREVLDVGASGLGYLSAAGSIGGVLATVIMAALSESRSKGLLLAASGAAAGAALFIFGFSSWYTASLFLAALVGLCLTSYDAIMGATLQLLSIDRMRGRILGLYSLTFGFTPLGGFVSGVIATFTSAAFAVSTGGVVIMAAVAVMLATYKGLKTVGNHPPQDYQPTDQENDCPLPKSKKTPKRSSEEE